jgi:O-succinylbenzoic acid--CoA ligase
MEASRTYLIGGRSYSKSKLLDLARGMVRDAGLPDWDREVYAFIEAFLDPSRGPIMQRTSGTTGDPGKHILERDAMRTSARRTNAFFGLRPGDRVLLGLPVQYIAGRMMVARALEGGLDLVLAEPSSTPLEGTEGTFRFVPMVPLQVHESLQQGAELSRIEILLVGGGELAPGLRSRLAGLESPEVYESFGMTETYSHFGLKRLNGPHPDRAFRLVEGAEVRADKRGCLVVDVEGVTAAPVHTRDLVEILDGGRGFRWLGRIDNVINTGGIKVIPEVLEERISALLGAPVLFLPRKDEKLGQALVMLVEWSGGGIPAERWQQLLRESLMPHEVPKKIIPVKVLPRNASFKPDRKAAAGLLKYES